MYTHTLSLFLSHSFSLSLSLSLTHTHTHTHTHTQVPAVGTVLGLYLHDGYSVVWYPIYRMCS